MKQEIEYLCFKETPFSEKLIDILPKSEAIKWLSNQRDTIFGWHMAYNLFQCLIYSKEIHNPKQEDF